MVHLVQAQPVEASSSHSTLTAGFSVCSHYNHAQNPFPITLQLEMVQLFGQTAVWNEKMIQKLSHCPYSISTSLSVTTCSKRQSPSCDFL